MNLSYNIFGDCNNYYYLNENHACYGNCNNLCDSPCTFRTHYNVYEVFKWFIKGKVKIKSFTVI